MVDCLRRKAGVQASPQDASQPTASLTSPTFPTSPTLSDAETLFSQLGRSHRRRSLPDLPVRDELLLPRRLRGPSQAHVPF